MAALRVDFAASRKVFSDAIYESLSNEEAEQEEELASVRVVYNDTTGMDNEKKLTFDQALRDAVKRVLNNSESDCDTFKKMASIATASFRHELCSSVTPFIVLADIFDTITLDNCAEVFSYVEETLATWKSESFYTAGRNYLLRMCNDLLRRLSKSQNTLFCGRIQLFLARLFPLSEKSGLNLMSQFNVENLTIFSNKAEELERSRKLSFDVDKEDNMDMEEGEMEEQKQASNIPVDYNLYNKFWSLQDFFRKPNQCYEKHPWKAFIDYADNVLRCFDSYKLDDMHGSRRRKLQKIKEVKKQTYFAKYLTSEKLLDLQLSDTNFRRNILLQFLILFQYLPAQVKFKQSSSNLTEEQTAWIRDCQDKVYRLLRETPPDGDNFASIIEHLLNREDNWNNWKNDGCQSYVRTPTEKSTDTKQKRSRKRSMGEDLKANEGKIIKMGNPELTRLWNLEHDNMNACASFQGLAPTLEEFFEDAIEQNDPEQQVEDEYKLINNPTWSWKALRLMARSSPHFFMHSNQVGSKKLSEYLDSMISKMAKELPGQAQGGDSEVRTEVGEEEDIKEEAQATDTGKKEEEASKDETDMQVSKQQLESVAEALKEDWKKLAVELNFPDEDLEYITTEIDDTAQQANKMLILWMENEGDRATVGALRLSLVEIGFVSIAEDCIGLPQTSF